MSNNYSSFFILHSSLSCGASRRTVAASRHNSSFVLRPSSLPCGASRRTAGFTLVEISMVMLLFASAIGGLLSFFPVGLRLESNAISDSAQTMFALNLLGQIEANANNIADWSVWKDDDKFWNAILKDVKVDNRSTSLSTSKDKTSVSLKDSSTSDYVLRSEGTLGESSGYLKKGGHINYILQESFFDAPFYDNKKRIRRIALWITDHRDGDPSMSKPFTLDLVFHPSLEKIFPEEG